MKRGNFKYYLALAFLIVIAALMFFHKNTNNQSTIVTNSSSVGSIARQSGTPKVAVIIANLGHVEQNLEFVTKNFPKQVLLGFSPYTQNITSVTASFKKKWMALIDINANAARKLSY